MRGSLIEADFAVIDGVAGSFKRKLEASSRLSFLFRALQKRRVKPLWFDFSLKIAQFEKLQEIQKYKEAKLTLERMRVSSPFSGIVEKIESKEGESVKALQSVVRVVKTDPLWIDAAVPSVEAEHIKVGQIIKTEFPNPNRETKDAKVIFVSNVIDAGSNTLRVRLEVQNGTGRPSGEHVKVFFAE